MSPELQVVVVSGPEEAQRGVLGLVMAATAAGTGAHVQVYLVMDGVKWLHGDHCHRTLVPGYPPASELLDAVRAGGGEIEYCAHCAAQATCHHSESTADAVDTCGCASAGGIASYSVRMLTTPTVVF